MKKTFTIALYVGGTKTNRGLVLNIHAWFVLTSAIFTAVHKTFWQNYYRILLSVMALSLLPMLLSSQNKYSFFLPKKMEYPSRLPSKNNVWVFVMAGQSNMAGRARVDAEDTIANERILTINKNNELILAKEPLHFYEPSLSGLDCGLSFAKTLLKSIPDSIFILLIPAAVGGSSINQWLGDSSHRGVRLLTNLKDKMQLGSNYGIIKALLWHQGESDANKKNITNYQQKLSALHQKIRAFSADAQLPIITAGIGLFRKDNSFQIVLNKAIAANAFSDKNTYCVKLKKLAHIGDSVHFNAQSQRQMGNRMANQYIKLLKTKNK